MMREMTTASGLVHYSSGDRNPRVIYEALSFGLPVFVSLQSMPYVGLQCHPFAFLADANGTAAALNERLAAFVAYLDASDAAKAGPAAPRARDAGGNAQRAIRDYVSAELRHDAVYGAFCARFGLCASASAGGSVDPTTPWVADTRRRAPECAARPRRYENWRYHAWPATREIKHALRITNEPNCTIRRGHNCKTACYRRNAADLAAVDPPPWYRATHLERRDPGPWREPWPRPRHSSS